MQAVLLYNQYPLSHTEQADPETSVYVVQCFTVSNEHYVNYV